LVGEQPVTVRTTRGFSRLEWQKLRERNEALDCRVYARAAAGIIGTDRWPEATWRDLEAQFGKTVAALEPVTPAATAPPLTPAPQTQNIRAQTREPWLRTRRIRRSRWME
jgi:phage terminase large subunit GpA-like protein